MSKTLERLAATITARKDADPESSWTAKLLAKGPEKCAEKFGEEAIEAIIEAVKGDREKLTTEAADVSMLLFSAPKRIGLDDMATTLYDWTHPAAAAPEAPAADPVSPT